jgi:hypothetical protein
MPAMSSAIGPLSKPTRIFLWMIALLAGFFLTPCHDVLAGYQHSPPELFKPAIFGLIVAAIVQAQPGRLLGERSQRNPR